MCEDGTSAAARYGLLNVLREIERALAAPSPLPEWVVRALDQIDEVVSHPNAVRRRLDVPLNRFIASDPRGFEIYSRRRLSPGPRPTLASLGEEYGVSRTRIGHIEAAFVGRVESEIKGNSDSPIWAAASRLRALLGVVCRANDAARAVARLGPGAAKVADDPLRLEFLLSLAGPYDREGEWLYSSGAKEVLADALFGAVDGGPCAIHDVEALLEPLGVRPEWLSGWIDSQAGIRVVGDHVIRWSGALVDKAVAVLELEGQSLAMQDLFERIGETTKSLPGFAQQIQGDPRVLRRGIKLYGLAEWGGDEYTSIIDEMARAIESAGGAIDLRELAVRLSAEWGVSAGSVRACSRSPQFVVDDKGSISLSDGKSVASKTRPLGLTRGCFRLAGGWAFRRVVDRDVLRGSGSAIPRGFAAELGLAPGEATHLQAPGRTIRCSWRRHVATIGTLRSFCVSGGAGQGDYLFIVARGGRRVDVDLVHQEELARVNGLERLAMECGLGSESASIAAVGYALGLGRNAFSSELRTRLARRREQVLADLVPDGPADSGAVLDSQKPVGN